MDTKLYDRLITCIRVADSGCWEWQHALNSNGYGNIAWDGKYYGAHRAMYIALHGPIERKQLVLHRCDNRTCINPDHLFLGTYSDNMNDMYAKNRHAVGQSLGDKLKEVWTPEMRKERAKLTHERMRQQHEQAALAAGVPTDWKFCSRCNTWKERDFFYKNQARYDGLSVYCCSCKVAYDVANRRKNSN